MDKELVTLEKNEIWVFIKKYLSAISLTFLIILSVLMLTAIFVPTLKIQDKVTFLGIDIFSIMAQIILLIFLIFLIIIYSLWFFKTDYHDGSNFIKLFWNRNCFMFEVFHINQKNKSTFKKNYWFLWWFSIILMLGSATMFYYYGLSWDPEFQYLVDPQAVGFLIFGIIEIVVAFLYTFFPAFFIPAFYKQSRDMYFKTQDYKQKKAHIETLDLEKIPFKTLKQYYSLGLIPKNFYILRKRNYKKNNNTKI